jgi:hypothetical protein
VQVPPAPPRPALSEQLGIDYRRIPVLAIGRDVYIDTSLIAITLDRRFPEAAGFGTLFPQRKNGGGCDTGLIKAFVTSYPDRALFKLGVTLVPWDKVPANFVEDRSSVCPLQIIRRWAKTLTHHQYMGSPIEVQHMISQQPAVISEISSHLESKVASGDFFD